MATKAEVREEDAAPAQAFPSRTSDHPRWLRVSSAALEASCTSKVLSDDVGIRYNHNPMNMHNKIIIRYTLTHLFFGIGAPGAELLLRLVGDSWRWISGEVARWGVGDMGREVVVIPCSSNLPA